MILRIHSRQRPILLVSPAAGGALLLVGLALVQLTGCAKPADKNQAAKSPAAHTEAASSDLAQAGWENFGAPIPEATPVAAAEVLKTPEAFVGKTIQIEGTVAEVCQVKGCWMTMTAEDTSVRIKFKDYGFFVPKDCAGRTARMEGVLTMETTSVEEARHYLEDAGKHEEALAITEPVQSLTFMASGVRLKA